MSARLLYCYRLTVTLPEIDEDVLTRWRAYCDSRGWLDYNGRDLPFSWPSRRTYFSEHAAERKAELFRLMGATATVERSLPVAWPEVTTDG